MRQNVVQRAGQLSLPHVLAISKTERNRTKNIKPMSSLYNTPCIKHKLVVSIYSNTDASLAMSIPTILMVSRCQVSCFQSPRLYNSLYYCTSRDKRVGLQNIWQCNLLWRSSSIKPSCSRTELNRCTTTEIRWNKNEDARISLIVSTVHQSPAQLAQELKSIPVDCAVGLYRNGDRFSLRWKSSLLDHLVRCR